jgi:hypothetical protein
MSRNQVVLEGTVHADGTLELDEKLPLPAGRVRVTVQTCDVPAPPNQARFWALMERIWADQKARGHVPRTREEIDAEVNQLRDEVEEEARAVERLHEECQRARRQPGEASP